MKLGIADNVYALLVLEILIWLVSPFCNFGF
jgi:hypothetical protein